MLSRIYADLRSTAEAECRRFSPCSKASLEGEILWLRAIIIGINIHYKYCNTTRRGTIESKGKDLQ